MVCAMVSASLFVLITSERSNLYFPLSLAESREAFWLLVFVVDHHWVCFIE